MDSSRDPIPQSNDQIRAYAQEIMREMTKHPSWNVAQRQSWVATNYNVFSDTYPRLANICSAVKTFSDITDVTRMLDMMLCEMHQIDANTKSFDDASYSVGRNLGDRYINVNVNDNMTEE